MSVLFKRRRIAHVMIRSRSGVYAFESRGEDCFGPDRCRMYQAHAPYSNGRYCGRRLNSKADIYQLRAPLVRTISGVSETIFSATLRRPGRLRPALELLARTSSPTARACSSLSTSHRITRALGYLLLRLTCDISLTRASQRLPTTFVPEPSGTPKPSASA